MVIESHFVRVMKYDQPVSRNRAELSYEFSEFGEFKEYDNTSVSYTTGLNGSFYKNEFSESI